MNLGRCVLEEWTVTDKRRQKQNKAERVVWREFGNGGAMERGTPDLPPNQQSLRVQPTRKGKGGKTVTVISGFQSRPETLKALLKQLKNQCGTGGALKDDTLEIQGDHAEKLVALLKQMGYQAKKSGG
ncbi:translation initiation factor [filamentous cyanobacterium LEGE 07170]|nr:translation initiation factor [filamentous cyanobacterium LEGE 07170]